MPVQRVTGWRCLPAGSAELIRIGGGGLQEGRMTPAKQIEAFLSFIDQCHAEYRLAYDAVNEEDRKLQDLLHGIEFAADRAECNRMATKLKNSRKGRRRNKDIVKMNEQVVKFFEEKGHRDTLNRMRQLLGRQRKEEEYLLGERVYKARVNDGGK